MEHPTGIPMGISWASHGHPVGFTFIWDPRGSHGHTTAHSTSIPWSSHRYTAGTHWASRANLIGSGRHHMGHPVGSRLSSGGHPMGMPQGLYRRIPRASRGKSWASRGYRWGISRASRGVIPRASPWHPMGIELASHGYPACLACASNEHPEFIPWASHSHPMGYSV